MIKEFKDDYRFLSNFYITDVVYDGITYPSSEHAFAAQKTLDHAGHPHGQVQQPCDG